MPGAELSIRQCQMAAEPAKKKINSITFRSFSLSIRQQLCLRYRQPPALPSTSRLPGNRVTAAGVPLTSCTCFHKSLLTLLTLPTLATAQPETWGRRSGAPQLPEGLEKTDLSGTVLAAISTEDCTCVKAAKLRLQKPREDLDTQAFASDPAASNSVQGRRYRSDPCLSRSD